MLYHQLFHPSIVYQAWSLKRCLEQSCTSSRPLFSLVPATYTFYCYQAHGRCSCCIIFCFALQSCRKRYAVSLMRCSRSETKCPTKSTCKLRICNIGGSVCVRMIFLMLGHLCPALYVVRCTLQFDHRVSRYVKAYGSCFSKHFSCVLKSSCWFI